MKKVIVLLTVAVLLVFGLAITPVFGNLMQCITRDRYGNIAYVSGEDGSWQVPILVYSDSDINVYIPDGMISSTRCIWNRMESRSWKVFCDLLHRI